MTRKILYVLHVPRDAQTHSRDELAKSISKRGTVTVGRPDVQSVSLDPDEQLLEGEYRGQYAERMAREIRSLSRNNAIDTVPYYAVDENKTRIQTADDGYYSLQTATISPADPRNSLRSHWTWQVTVVKQGTQRSHWRAVRTKVGAYGSGENPFSAAETVTIGIPTTATKVRWWDEVRGDFESATVVSTNAGEFVDVDQYDVNSPSFSNPTLLYTLPYLEEGKGDTKVWDDHGNSSKVDGQNAVQWTRNFDSDREFEGQAIVENGILRLVFDEPNNSLTAFRWDSGTSSYASVSLGASDWVLFDLDLTRIGDDRVNGRVIFENTSTGALYHMKMSLKRGYDDAVWTVPANEDRSNFPSGLDTKLSPIASGIDSNPVAEKTAISRRETHK